MEESTKNEEKAERIHEKEKREKTGIPFERKMKIVGSDHLKPTSVFNGYKP